MSQRTRGRETTIQFSVDGQPLSGSFYKILEWTTTHRSELPETEFLGEPETDYDFRHDGYDFSFSVHELDDQVLNLIQTIIDREITGQSHPDIVITVIHSYRGTNAPRPKVEVWREVFLRPAEQNSPNRNEYNAFTFEGKGKRKQLVSA